MRRQKSILRLARALNTWSWRHHKFSYRASKRGGKTLTRDNLSKNLPQPPWWVVWKLLVLSISMWHPEWMPVLKPNSEEKYQKRTNIPQWRNIFKEDVVIKIPQKYFPINSRPKSKALKWDSKHKVLNLLLCA